MRFSRKSEIEKKYASLDGEKGYLGPPIDSEKTAADGIGHFREYKDGVIYWSPDTGAHEVHGAILYKWNTLDRERGILGYPKTDEEPTDDGQGRYSHFQKGSIYWSAATGAHEIHGPVLELWEQLEREKSPLGYPIADECAATSGHGIYKKFQHGAIYYDPERGAYEVFPLPSTPQGDETAQGRWDDLLCNSRVVGVHGALLHTGDVLFFSHGNQRQASEQEVEVEVGSAILNPWTEVVARREIERGTTCSGHSFLPDGRLIVCGSERKKVGVHAVRAFTPGETGEGYWEHVCDIADARWYPTCATLPDGQIIIVGGHKWFEDQNVPNPTYQLFHPERGLGEPLPIDPLERAGELTLYPFVFVLPSGKLFVHAGTRSCFLDLATWKFDRRVLKTAWKAGRNSRTYDTQGTCVLLPLLPDTHPPYRARIMMIGGGGAAKVNARTPATETCELLDTGAWHPSWKLAAPMHTPRVMPDAVLLPDGNVFVTNGSSTGKSEAGANPVLAAELYDTVAGTWTTLASMTIPRLYHSVALLLPDGRVLTAGTDSIWYPAPFKLAKSRIEVFSPPYLFRGPAPIIQRAPGTISYDTEFVVGSPSAPTISKACLISPASVTHSFNSNQRYVGLSIIERNGNNLTLKAPPDPNVAPPGYYMLFIVNEGGVPSSARFTRLGSEAVAAGS